jgi:hypothetical protein
LVIVLVNDKQLPSIAFVICIGKTIVITGQQ